MALALAAVTLFLVILLLVTGIGKYARAEPIENNLEASDVPRKYWSPLATLEMAGALGLIAGWFFRPLGILTSGCLIAYFAGAVGAHVKAGDKNVVPSGSGMGMSAVALVLFILNTKARRAAKRGNHTRR